MKTQFRGPDTNLLAAPDPQSKKRLFPLILLAAFLAMFQAGSRDGLAAVLWQKIVDYGDPGYSETGNSWRNYVNDQSHNGTYRYLSHWEVERPRFGTATWQITIPQDGYYRVEVSYRQTENRSPNANYFASNGQGGLDETVINQAGVNAYIWRTLGEYYYTAGERVKVFLDGTDDNESDCADAASWTLVPAPARPVNLIPIIALLKPEREFLHVTKEGPGDGVVYSSPGGLFCGSACDYAFTKDSQVDLQATPDRGWSLSGWSDDWCSGSGICTLTMDEEKTVTAFFDGPLTRYNLSVSVGGVGGTVISSPVDADGQPMSCFAGTCVRPYYENEKVTLIGDSKRTRVDSWTGDCTDTADPDRATVNMGTAAKSCTANFVAKDQYDLSVTLAGTGGGTVTSVPESAEDHLLSCTVGPCTKSYYEGDEVVLTANADGGSTFTGWGGDDDCKDGRVTMDSARSCTATFMLGGIKLTVKNISPNGSHYGDISSVPAALSCPGSSDDVNQCLANFVQDSTVILRAITTAGSFQGWWCDDDNNTTSSEIDVTMAVETTCYACFGSSVELCLAKLL